MNAAEQLVVVLGWCLEDFIAEIKKAPMEALVGALKILESPDPPEFPLHLVQRAKTGVLGLKHEIETRSSRSP